MKTLAIAALACGALLTGCGEDAEPSADPNGPPALTTSQFVKQANALCAKQEKDHQAQDLSHIKTRAQYLRWVESTAIPLIEADLRELEALVPPAGLRDDFTALIDTGDGLMADVKADPALILDDAYFAAYNRQAQALGLPKCAD